ncbi:MAG: hypothetical protein WD000_09230, partial [Thermodesulfobacteriota bacterium]
MNESNAAFKILEDSTDLNNYCNSERVTKRKSVLHLYSLPFDYKVSSDEVLVRLFVNNRDENAFNEI